MGNATTFGHLMDHKDRAKRLRAAQPQQRGSRGGQLRDGSGVLALGDGLFNDVEQPIREIGENGECFGNDLFTHAGRGAQQDRKVNATVFTFGRNAGNKHAYEVLDSMSYR